MSTNNRENLAVVYARYSSAGQREQSIDGQLAAAFRLHLRHPQGPA